MKIQERFNFYYSLLLDEEKRIYIEIVSALRKFNKIVKINMIHKDIDFHAIICAIKEDNPELFYVNFSAVTITMSNFCATVYFAFFYNDVDIYWIMKELSSVVATISLSGNILQDEFNIHKYIANNVEYDYSGSSFDSFTIKGALIDRKAVCEGYSKAFKFLCDFAKIPCLIISGTAKNYNGMVQNHAWNIVNINGDYYHVDSTWNRDSLEKLGLSLYLNISDKFISGNHTWQKEKYPQCRKTSNLELKIVSINDKAQFQKAINDAVCNLQRHLLLSINYSVDGEKEIKENIKDFVSGTVKFGLKSYHISYIKELNCGVVLFDY